MPKPWQEMNQEERHEYIAGFAWSQCASGLVEIRGFHKKTVKDFHKGWWQWCDNHACWERTDMWGKDISVLTAY